MTVTFDPSATSRADAKTASAVLSAGVLAEAVRHGEDVAAIAQIEANRWTDALLSEVRSHVAGCLNSVELAIRVELSGDRVEQALDALGEGICRSALDTALALLSPALVEHFRLRAAAALILRMARAAPPLDAFVPSDDGPVTAATAVDDEAGDALIALALSIDPWYEPHATTRPMRADLPAECYCELGWTAAALLLDALDRAGVDGTAATGRIVSAVEAVIARHDEQNGPFARASYAAGLLADDRANELANSALANRNLLLIGAIAGRKVRLRMEVALAILVDGDDSERAAIGRLLGFDDEAYVALLAMISPLQGGETIDSLPDRVAEYRALTPEAASAVLARRRGPEALVSRRLRLERARR